MAKKKPIRKPTKAMVAAQARIATQQELLDALRKAETDGQQLRWKQEREIHQLKQRPTQVRRVVRVIEYVGDPVAIAETLASSLPQGASDRGKFVLTCTLIEDVTRDVIVRAEATRG